MIIANRLPTTGRQSHSDGYTAYLDGAKSTTILAVQGNLTGVADACPITGVASWRG